MRTLYYYFVSLIDFLASLAENNFATHGLGRALRQFRREVVIFKAHHKNCSRNQTVNKQRFDKVQIGGGAHVLPGFLNIDVTPPADLVCDVRQGFSLDSSSLKLIFSEHFLEHIDYPNSVKKFIAECYRVLKPGGQIILGVPDAKAVIRGYAKDDKGLLIEQTERWYGKRNCAEHINTYIDLVNYVFRDQDDDKKYTPHLWAYDYEKLEGLFKQVGFTNIKPWKFDEQIAKPKRKWGSIYVTATK